MSVSEAEIDLFYLRILARHASLDEQAQWSALSNSLDTPALMRQIDDAPEVTSYVDPVFRLYQGAFGRLPDWHNPNGPNNFDNEQHSGLWANVNALREGIGIVGLAEAFVASNEFHNLYGTTNVTPALIVSYYSHVLGRAASGDEVAAWMGTGQDAAHILVGFTESSEFVARAASAIEFKKEQITTQNHYTIEDDSPLPPPPPEYSLDVDPDQYNGVHEGDAVRLTLQGPATVAGKTFSYVIRGIDAEDIVGGQLVGSVTLDQHGTGHFVLNIADDHLIEGTEVFNIEFPGIPNLDRNVTIIDAAVASHETNVVGMTSFAATSIV